MADEKKRRRRKQLLSRIRAVSHKEAWMKENAVDVKCPHCHHYPVRVEPDTRPPCPKCGKLMW